jgi:hypothetical protein
MGNKGEGALHREQRNFLSIDLHDVVKIYIPIQFLPQVLKAVLCVYVCMYVVHTVFSLDVLASLLS